MKVSATQLKIRNSARDLFKRYGLKKVSIEDICNSAEISKMTFYRNFSNKSDIAYKVIENELIIGQNTYDEIMNSDMDFKKKIHEIIQKKNENSQSISMEFLSDIFNSEEADIQKLIQNHTDLSIQKVRIFFNEAKEKNFIRKEINIELLILMINSFAQKMKDPAFLSIFKSPEEAVRELNNFFFYGIMQIPDNE
ncbi:MAG: TetR/AcrR family transcriptional regulator [Cytophagaceae bacterium]|nr:TetR/AcrR family transcriptional regulator [Cytophagaceae bacterium]MBL0300250.1 TetR/AcrR family transcriptional regulator [Cytophagaceae bacterium]